MKKTTVGTVPISRLPDGGTGEGTIPGNEKRTIAAGAGETSASIPASEELSPSERAQAVVRELKKKYPRAECSLSYEGEPWRLLVMGRLSAQCTDARVNQVCEQLFARYPTPEALASGELSDIEAIVRPCGLYRTKAVQIQEECRMLTEKWGGRLPDTMDELLQFPGVGRKIANLLLGDIYHKPAIVADTHCIRICGRIGFYPEALKDPEKVEKILAAWVEPAEQSDLCHRLVLFGREICSARAPACSRCPIRSLCRHGSETDTR